MPDDTDTHLHTGGRVTLTEGVCRAAGHDTAMRRMRKAGRAKWNDDDWNAAAERTARLMVVGGHWPVELYEMHTGKPFVAEAA